MAAPVKDNRIEDAQNIEINLKSIDNRTMSKIQTEVQSGIDAKSPYAVNKALFEAATKIKNHLELVEKRLRKMEEHHSQVSESVYLKVKTDYETQIDEIKGQFEEKRSEVDSELRQLYQAKSKQEVELAKHQEVLEEAKFRHVLGEYTDRHYKEIESKQNKYISDFNNLLEIIQGSIQQYENILGHSYSVENTYEEPKNLGYAVTSKPAPPTNDYNKAKLGWEEIDDIDAEYTPALGSFSSPPPSPKPSAPPISTREQFSAPAPSKTLPTEASLEAELDHLLQSESSGDDYLNISDKAISPSPAETVASKPKASHLSSVKAETEDSSISSILRGIPMEPEAAETKMAAAPVVEPIQKPVAGKPIPSLPEASLLLIEGELEDPEIILGESLSIGRSPSNDLVLKESKISRQHATIHYREGAFWLVDLKSSNGVYVNDQRLEESVLKDGDEIKVGSFKFQFSLL